MIQIALIIAMGGLQVFVVRFFFQVRAARVIWGDVQLTRNYRVHERVMFKRLIHIGSEFHEAQVQKVVDIGNIMYNQGMQFGLIRGYRPVKMPA